MCAHAYIHVHIVRNTHTHTYIRIHIHIYSYSYTYIHTHTHTHALNPPAARGTQKRARAESEAVHAQSREPSAPAGADASRVQGFKATADVAGTPTSPTSKFLKSQDTSTMYGECTRALTFQKAMQRACKALHCGQNSNQPLPRPRLFRHTFSKVPPVVSFCSNFAWGLTCESFAQWMPEPLLA
jgi:hypothetical protein